MKISIVVPNFNGEKLLEKNLPNILEAGADEIIMLDDFSTDGSLKILEELRIKGKELRVLVNQRNLGFIPSVNRLFNRASGDIVVLLNNDVWVEMDFLKPLIKYFENPKVFAVNLHEVGEGPAVSFWKDGFYEFKRGEELGSIQKSAWASGGSAAFRKNIWQKLGGFDEIYAPFYWEDIDISFRALKAGYEILWGPSSKVKHQHETTIKKNFSERYIKWVQQRNQFLFIWKNINDPKLKSEHKKGLFKRLFNGGVGYWIPFLWALTVVILNGVKNIYPSASPQDDSGMRSDLEAINYANP